MYVHTCIYLYSVWYAQWCDGLFPRYVCQIVSQCVKIMWVDIRVYTCMYICIHFSIIYVIRSEAYMYVHIHRKSSLYLPCRFSQLSIEIPGATR